MLNLSSVVYHIPNIFYKTKSICNSTLLLSICCVFIISDLTNSQLIEKWKVDIPSIPEFNSMQWFYDMDGNAYGVRYRYGLVDSTSKYTFDMQKVSPDGLLKWHIQDVPWWGIDFRFHDKITVDKFGNIYIVGSTYNDTSWCEMPFISKYSNNGVKLFQKAIKPNLTNTEYGYDIEAWGTNQDGITLAYGMYNYLSESGTNVLDKGVIQSISPNGGIISEIYLDDADMCEQSNGPLGPDMFGNYVLEFGSYADPNGDQSIAHFIGYNAATGIRWMYSSPPSTDVGDYWRLYNYIQFQSGSIYYVRHGEISKYSSTFQHQWTKTYSNNETLPLAENPYDQSVLIYAPSEAEHLICYDADGSLRWQNSLPVPNYNQVTFGPNHDIYTIAGYSQPFLLMRINYQTGDTVWTDTLDLGPNFYAKLLVDFDGDITIAGYDRVMKFSQGIEITKPKKNDLMIAGEVDTIKWKGGVENLNIYLTYSTDGGNTFDGINIAPIASTDGKYAWEIPDDIMGRKSIIKVLASTNFDSLGVSDTFKLKPYIITKVDESGEYVAYDINKNRWGFSNKRNEMWPQWWWERFDYKGMDEFTESQYTQWDGHGVFSKAKRSDFPDWPSFVRTFGVGQCYVSTFLKLYRDKAMEKWALYKGAWNGSCFGIAISNALAFQKKKDFTDKYDKFPTFTNPMEVSSNADVIPVISELFTHQFGSTHLNFRYTYGLPLTPNQTIWHLKNMMSWDNVTVRTLSFNSNSNDTANLGGHAIIAYKLKHNKTHPTVYDVYVWDNSYPDSLNAIIEVDTSANGGKGSWEPKYGWSGWGGDKWFYLRDWAEDYLSLETLPKQKTNQIPFVLDNGLIHVHDPYKSDILISNNNSESIGISEGKFISSLPGAVPDIVETGRVSRPIGYIVPADQYSIELSNFSDTTNLAELHIAKNNKTYVYSREDALQNETDHIFFDDGVSISNPDSNIKTTGMWNIISDTSQERVFTIRSMNLSQGDSIKYINPDDYKLNIISFGSAKSYEVELKGASQSGLQRFLHSNINLAENTTHKLSPNWGDFAAPQLTIYVDEGNDVTIDDTLILDNELTGTYNNHGSLIPNDYKLEQNYPNPFNPITTIKYSIPKQSYVTLKVYDILGREVATLINGTKQPGEYEIEINDSNIPSGVYFYQLKAGEFIQTKKMILIK